MNKSSTRQFVFPAATHTHCFNRRMFKKSFHSSENARGVNFGAAFSFCKCENERERAGRHIDTKKVGIPSTFFISLLFMPMSFYFVTWGMACVVVHFSSDVFEHSQSKSTRANKGAVRRDMLIVYCC